MKIAATELNLTYSEILSLNSDQIVPLVISGLTEARNTNCLLFAAALFKRHYSKIEEKELTVVFQALQSGLLDVGDNRFLNAYNAIYNTQHCLTDPKIGQFLDRISFEFYLEIASFMILWQRRQISLDFLSKNFN